jgi:hypothetical protein
VAAIKSTQTLAALTSAALALPGILTCDARVLPAGEAQATFQYSRYEEGDNRVRAHSYDGSVSLPLTSRLTLLGSWMVDIWSGATPLYNAPASFLSGVGADKRPVQVMTGASPSDSRRQFALSTTYQFDDLALTIAGGNSNEPDYNTNFYNIQGVWETNQKLATYTLGFTYSDDELTASNRSDLG